VIDAIVAGRVFGKPAARSAKNGSRFVTAKVRLPTRGCKSRFVNVVTFSQSAGGALLALGDGDSVALVGELAAKAYADKAGAPQPSLDLLAQQVLTPLQVQRKRQAMKNGSELDTKQTLAAASHAPTAAPEREFNDEIPF